ncbi:hypothetical protein M8C21_016278 [Ambrosia artemisiifolia]|uniref:Uncharacterized protein n=1 Tax=Ambrosia artemisiifolia TaxID=4212 RepID=A0AAD5GKE9_AMBAR|nr:hypothetical protein M8C21_016278 [Ambrosia artemisiifolia]
MSGERESINSKRKKGNGSGGGTGHTLRSTTFLAFLSIQSTDGGSNQRASALKPLRLDIKRKLAQRSERVKSVDLHPTEPWILKRLFSGTVNIWDYQAQVHLKSDSHFEFSDVHNDSATIATREIDDVKCQDDESKEDISRINEPVSFDEVSPSNNSKSTADDFLEIINPPITSEAIKDPATTNGHQISCQLDLGDAYKLAISTKGRQLSGKLLDQKSFNNSSARIGKDLKILLSHRSNDSLISPSYLLTVMN